MITGHKRLVDLPTDHNEQHRKLYLFALPMLPATFTTVPTTDTLPLNYAARYITGSTRRIYFNFDNTLTYIALVNA